MQHSTLGHVSTGAHFTFIIVRLSSSREGNDSNFIKYNFDVPINLHFHGSLFINEEDEMGTYPHIYGKIKLNNFD